MSIKRIILEALEKKYEAEVDILHLQVKLQKNHKNLSLERKNISVCIGVLIGEHNTTYMK